MAKCPVCQQPVDEAAARMSTGTTPGGAMEVDPKAGTRQFHDGTWYYFDSLDCRNKFTRDPDSYVK